MINVLCRRRDQHVSLTLHASGCLQGITTNIILIVVYRLQEQL